MCDIAIFVLSDFAKYNTFPDIPAGCIPNVQYDNGVLNALF